MMLVERHLRFPTPVLCAGPAGAFFTYGLEIAGNPEAGLARLRAVDADGHPSPFTVLVDLRELAPLRRICTAPAGVGVLAVGWFLLGLNPGEMRTLTFLMLVLAGQATVYVLRERGHLWSSRPASIMLFASSGDIAIVISLAIGGVLMTPLPLAIVGILLIATLAFGLALDGIKIAVAAGLRID